MFKKLFNINGASFLLLVFCVQASQSESQTPNTHNQSNYKLKTKAKHITKPSILVPPPPPEQPSLLDWSGFGSIPDSISYLNADELGVKLEHVRKQISNTKTQINDDQTQLASLRERATRFESLFSEGVVSRKELEAAKKDVSDSEKYTDQDKNEFSDLELQEGAIVRQLNLRKHGVKTKHISKSNPTVRRPKASEKSK